jgi:hypothetical protein
MECKCMYVCMYACMYVRMYVCMYVLLCCRCRAQHTQDSSTFQPLPESLYVLSYRRPKHPVHSPLSGGHKAEFRLFPQTETVLLSARAMYSRTVASSQLYFICTVVLVRFNRPQPLPNNASLT